MAVFVLCVQDYRERYVYGDDELIRQSNVRVRSMPATVKVKSQRARGYGDPGASAFQLLPFQEIKYKIHNSRGLCT